MVTLLLLFIFCCLLYIIWNQPPHLDAIPGPVGLPLIGNLLDLIGKDPLLYYKTITDRYGPLASVQMGCQRVILISSAGMAREVLMKHGSTFEGRPRGTLLDFIMRGKGIVMTTGPATQVARALLHNSLKEIGSGRDEIETYIDMEVQDFMNILKTKAGTSYNPQNDLSVSILNVTWQMISGDRFHLEDSDIKWFIESIELSLAVVEPVGFLNFIFVLQAIATLLNPKALKLFLGLIRRNNFFNKIIERHRKEMDDDKVGRDFVFDFLETQKKKSKGRKDIDFIYSDTQLKWIMSDVFVAGLETTTSTIRWSLLVLVTQPDIQEKLNAEIEAVVGRHRTPVLSDRKRMPYTEAFIAEALRVYPAIPIVFHAASEDTHLGSSIIPKGTWVFINIWAIHMDKKIWGDPEVFRPERFIGENNFLRSPHHMPFSVGAKSCPGNHLATSELFLYLTNVLQHYKITTPVGCPKPRLDKKRSLSLMPPECDYVFMPKV